MGLFFLFSSTVFLWLALRFPLWVLVLGPLSMGIPHLLSTLRYVPKSWQDIRTRLPARSSILLGILFVLVAGFALLRERTALLSIPLGIPELLIAFAFCFYFNRTQIHFSQKKYFAIFLFLLSAGFLVRWPVATLGVFLLGHNLIAYFYWILRAPTKNDRRLALFASLIFVSVTGMLLAGLFDPIMSGRSFWILNAQMGDSVLGSQIFQNGNQQIWSRLVSAYAFGQSSHYFVWLRAVPEQELPQGFPISFRQSWRDLLTELSPWVLAGAFVTVVGLIYIGSYFSLATARDLYLTIAFFHGFFEVAGLAFIQRPSLS